MNSFDYRFVFLPGLANKPGKVPNRNSHCKPKRAAPRQTRSMPKQLLRPSYGHLHNCSMVIAGTNIPWASVANTVSPCGFIRSESHRDLGCSCHAGADRQDARNIRDIRFKQGTASAAWHCTSRRLQSQQRLKCRKTPIEQTAQSQ
jgi:hypothetical protein